MMWSGDGGAILGIWYTCKELLLGYWVGNTSSLVKNCIYREVGYWVITSDLYAAYSLCSLTDLVDVEKCIL